MNNKTDLNLLRILDALLQEGSVTRAAKRVHLAQPTVSNALARLRGVFGDPLLSRRGKHMRPTAKAQQLMAPLRDAMAQLDRVLAREPEFDPLTSVRTIRLATTDYLAFVLVPPLLRHMGKHAPEMRLVVSELDVTDPLGAIGSGEVDLAVGAVVATTPNLHQSELFTDRYVCIARKGHPDVKGRLTSKQFLRLGHLSVRQQHGGISGTIDSAFDRMKVRRKVLLALPHLLCAPYAILESDLVLTLPSSLATEIGRILPVNVLAHPLNMNSFVISQLWHERTHTDAAQLWFRGSLQRVAKEIRATA